METLSLAEFAETFEHRSTAELPVWLAHGPLPLDVLGVRGRLEDVLDTVTSLQRADWLQDGVYVGPNAMPEAYSAVLHAARELGVAVPPAIAAGGPFSRQGIYGTDARSFLYLSTYYLAGTSEEVKRFAMGRALGHLAARQVTASTLYNLLVDQTGLRSVAKRAVGPMLEVFLAPLSLGVRMALSRWHRGAELSCDRAGLLCCRDLDAATDALLKSHLGINRHISREEYLDQLRRSGHEHAPGRWTELLAEQPFTRKRLRALELFHRSQMYARLTGEPAAPDALDDEALRLATARVLGVEV